jgi:hypothetical protein
VFNQRSEYDEYGGQQDYNMNKKSNGIGIDDPRTVLRNKIAFLKNKGIIIRE